MILEKLHANACVIVDNLAFEVVGFNEQQVLRVTDMSNLDYKAMYYKRGDNLYLSVSSFRCPKREKDLLSAVQINERLLVDEMRNAKGRLLR